jgi:hypothetical protein
MSFTDDDLKRLKDLLRDKGDLSTFFDTYEDMEALLVRLEAAEEVISHAISQRKVHTPETCYDGNPVPIEIVEAWRKACGL